MATPIRVRGAETMDTTFEQSLQLLVLLFGNGLEGDVRLEGSSADAVVALRALVVGPLSTESLPNVTVQGLRRLARP